MADVKFVTALNCMDGRVQIPVIDYLKTKYFADYVDMITAPGMDKIIAENTNAGELGNIHRNIAISINKHESSVIAIVGHADCAGNPVSDEQHVADTRKSVENLKVQYPGLEILGLMVNAQWQVVELG